MYPHAPPPVGHIENEQTAPLPPFTDNQLLMLVAPQVDEHQTRAPARYTEAALVQALEQRGIGRPSTYAGMVKTVKDKGYVKVSQKEPFDIVYFTPSLTWMVNLADKSWSLTPELLYTGITNLDLRLRATWLHGKSYSEFGEKQNRRKLELMARFYF
jgi:hypothetical protein